MITVNPHFGSHDSGQQAKLWTMKNEAGYEASVSDFGAVLVRMVMPSRDGKCDDCVLGFDSVPEYIKDSPYFGATCGRVANRIAKGQFSVDGDAYQVATNNGPNHLHGGDKGWNSQMWDASSVITPEGPSVTFTRVSPDGEEGYPGTVKVKTTYTLTHTNELRILMEAETDRSTPVNMAHHTYWNLGGHANGDILDHHVKLHATKWTPTDDTLIPTGEVNSVVGTCFDLSNGHRVGDRISQMERGEPHVFEVTNGGFDFNYVVDNSGWGKVAQVAKVHDGASGRTMEVFSNQPGVQFYTGSWIDGPLPGKAGAAYNKYAGLCLETQLFPDSVNQEENPLFPSALLHPGESYYHLMIHKFSVQ